MKIIKQFAVIVLGLILITGCSSSGEGKTEELSSEVSAVPAVTERAAAENTEAADTAVSEATTETAAAVQEQETKPETNGHLVCIDPGHSGAQTGKYVPLGPGSSEKKLGDSVGTHGTASGLTEYELTMTISQKLRTELEKRGYSVILTHEDNSTPIDCDARAQVANNAGADCLIRLHADGSESSSASGAMAINITSSNPWNAQTYSESRRLSDDVLSAYVQATGLSSRGVLEEDNMTGNNWSQVPCTLIEMGFMTNPDEDLKMADSDFQEKMVDGLADGIDEFFER